MSNSYVNGYTETIQRGLSAVSHFRSGISAGTGSRDEQVDRLKREIERDSSVALADGTVRQLRAALFGEDPPASDDGHGDVGDDGASTADHGRQHVYHEADVAPHAKVERLALASLAGY